MIPYYETRYEKFFYFDWHNLVSWPQHIHHQTEVIYLKKGSLDIEIDEAYYTLNSGDLAVVCPNRAHSLHSKDYDNDEFLLMGYVFYTSLAGEYENIIPTSSEYNPVIRAANITDEEKFLLNWMAENSKCKDELLLKSHVQLFIACIWNNLNIRRVPKKKQDISYKIVNYIMKNYTNPIQASDVARALGISPSYLARVLADKLGMNFNEYLNRIRVQLASELLRSADYTITRVMLDCGFKSQSTFNRAFIKYMGISPREYRNSVSLR